MKWLEGPLGAALLHALGRILLALGAALVASQGVAPLLPEAVESSKLLSNNALPLATFSAALVIR